MRLYASLCVVWCKSVYFCAIWYIYTINYATIHRAYFCIHQMTIMKPSNTGSRIESIIYAYV